MSARPRRTPAWWFDAQQPVPLWARAIEPVYAAASGLRRSLYRRGWLRSRRMPVPVLVIGNLTAGGSGKTPLVIAIARDLQQAGWQVGVATRGYGRDAADTPLWVTAQTDPALGGDEPVLIARRSGARVRADADRAAAAQALVDADCNVVLCDDGLQHYRLARDVEIEVVDARRRYGNGRLLPAGPLREPAARGAQWAFRIWNLGDADSAAGSDSPFGHWPMQLHIGAAEPLLHGRAIPLQRFAGQRVHAVAGIGDPERFFATLRGQGIAVVPHAFGDHHRFQPADLQFGSDLPVLMTEKDAVKCHAFANERHFAVPVEARLPEAFWLALRQQLDGLRGTRPDSA